MNDLNHWQSVIADGDNEDAVYKMLPSAGMKQGSCLECGDPILYGRQDKKFCCESCKNKYNNRKTRSSKISKVRVLHALEKNYDILRKLLRHKVNSIDMTDLRHLGFDFDHVTSYHKYRRSTELWCYDIKITVSGSRVKSIDQVSCLPDGTK